MKITIIGGGTGSSAVLNGLKKYPDLDLNVIVSMADDGGSNAVIRDEFGLLPMSDLRKSIISLSELPNNDKLRELFTYRFAEGDGLRGHTLGNLMMIAANSINGSEKEALEYICEIFRVKHNVIPVTYSDSRLFAKFSDGSQIKGEHLIDEPEIADGVKLVEFWMEPKSEANPDAVKAIQEADFIIVGPGDLYTTTLANIIVDGIVDAICKSKGKKILITNIMSKVGQTKGMKQSEIVATFGKYCKCKFDYLLVNSESIPDRVISYYKEHGEHLLEDDLDDSVGKIIRADLIADEIFERDKGDDLVRSMVRHDSDRLGWELYKLMKEGR
ncbi:MAG: YvcK family protein [Candidatus Dojkabacteria bacterium]|nr:MAG: YvcK family protein [Candidatus Dojkabacteria bacterium]